jgi:hypothetical protein
MHQVGFIYKIICHVILKNFVNQNTWGSLSTICVWYIACWIGRGLLCAVPCQGVFWSLPDHNHPFVAVFTVSLACVSYCHPSMACPQVLGKWVYKWLKITDIWDELLCLYGHMWSMWFRILQCCTLPVWLLMWNIWCHISEDSVDSNLYCTPW